MESVQVRVPLDLLDRWRSAALSGLRIPDTAAVNAAVDAATHIKEYQVSAMASGAMFVVNGIADGHFYPVGLTVEVDDDAVRVCRDGRTLGVLQLNPLLPGSPRWIDGDGPAK